MISIIRFFCFTWIFRYEELRGGHAGACSPDWMRIFPARIPLAAKLRRDRGDHRIL